MKKNLWLMSGILSKTIVSRKKKKKKKKVFFISHLANEISGVQLQPLWKEYCRENPGKGDRTMFTKSRRIAIHKDKQRVVEIYYLPGYVQLSNNQGIYHKCIPSIIKMPNRARILKNYKRNI